MNWKNFKSKRNIALFSIIAVILAATVTVCCVLISGDTAGTTVKPSNNSNTAESSDKIEYLNREVYKKSESVDLGTPNKDVGVMIMDCDGTSGFTRTSNISVISKSGAYVQGKASFGRISPMQTVGTAVFEKTVDISAYKNGSVHISIYVSNPENINKEIWLELSSSGKSDVDEISWIIPRTAFKEGWNDFYLAIEGAYLTGNVNLSKINFFRMFEINPVYGLTLYYDNIYATATKGKVYSPGVAAVKKDFYEEGSSAYGKMIMSCDTVNILDGITSAKVTTESGCFVEGTGAFKLDLPKSASAFVLKKSVDISAYKDGYIHLSLYLSDKSLITQCVVFEISSSGTYDKEEYNYVINASKLQNGWNHLWLPISSGAPTGNIDLTKVNYLRIYGQKALDGLVAYLDDIYVTNEDLSVDIGDSAVKNGKLILGCDDKADMTNINGVELTTAPREFVAGTGAFKIKNSVVWLSGILKKSFDISPYKNAYVHISLYVNDISKLVNDIAFELSSNKSIDKNEYQFKILKSNLSNGWNECYLKISDAEIVGGNPNDRDIKRIRIYSSGSKNGLVTIVDNIYATTDSSPSNVCSCGKPIYDGDILMGDCTCNFKNYFNLKNDTECVEGNYSLQAKNSAVAMYAEFNNPVNISAASFGYLHLQLYISNTEYLKNNVSFELSSSGTHDKDELAWEIDRNTLSRGWNEIWLPVKTANITGKPDLTKINYFRLCTAQPNINLVVRLDDVYGIAG